MSLLILPWNRAPRSKYKTSELNRESNSGNAALFGERADGEAREDDYEHSGSGGGKSVITRLQGSRLNVQCFTNGEVTPCIDRFSLGSSSSLNFAPSFADLVNRS